MAYKQIDYNHPGIQLVEKMRRNMQDNDIYVDLNEKSAGIQKKCLTTLQNGGIPNKDDADLLHKLEVAQAYVGAIDINNSTSRKKIVNALNGESATGNSLMSTFIKKQIDMKMEQKNTSEKELGSVTFKM
jgi:hypothetical protein